MKTNSTMRTLVEKLAKKHSVDFSQPGAHLRLENEPYERLVIENVGRDRVSIAHYYEQNGDLIADPDIVFKTDALEWYPIEIQQPQIMLMGRVMGGYQHFVNFGPDDQPISYNKEQQADCAHFAKQWAHNIREQRWIQDGIRT